MVEVTRLTREEVKATLAELDAKHPDWADYYEHPSCCRAHWMDEASGWGEWHDDMPTYESYRFLLGEDE